jgi:hypothetical protein
MEFNHESNQSNELRAGRVPNSFVRFVRLVISQPSLFSLRSPVPNTQRHARRARLVSSLLLLCGMLAIAIVHSQGTLLFAASTFADH